MRFGLFYEHQSPRPWTRDSDRVLFDNILTQMEHADKLGYDYIWLAEHHFLEEYAHSSAPELILAAAAQRTERIRMAHGIVVTVPKFNHPARVAERIATLDLLSNGRVEFGSGESASTTELDGFEVDPVEKREMWEEGLRVAIECLSNEPFKGYKGKHVSMPPRNVVPKPLQKPHPPLWVACTRRDTIRMAGEKGIGALSFSFVDPEEARTWVEEYEKALEVCEPIGYTINPQISAVTPMMVHENAEEALMRGMEGNNFFGYANGHYYVYGQHRPGVTDVWREFQEKRDERGFAPNIEKALQQEVLGARIASEKGREGLRGAIGTPEQVRDFARRYEQAGIDQLIFLVQAGNTRHEHIMETLTLFAKEIMPEFKARDSAFRKKKAERLQPLLDAAMARRPEDKNKVPDNYAVVPAMRDFLSKKGGETRIDDIKDKFANEDGLNDAELMQSINEDLEDALKEASGATDD